MSPLNRVQLWQNTNQDGQLSQLTEIQYHADIITTVERKGWLGQSMMGLGVQIVKWDASCFQGSLFCVCLLCSLLPHFLLPLKKSSICGIDLSNSLPQPTGLVFILLLLIHLPTAPRGRYKGIVWAAVLKTHLLAESKPLHPPNFLI